MAIQKIVTDDALSAFASDVKAAIANVSSPLVYKGTLGTGGTISTLPAASASNNGFAYVVITAGTYQGVVCAVGDVIASNGTAWNIIPQANSAETLPITNGSAVNTKEYIDDKTTLVKSASGSLIHITDGGDNIPVKSLESEIVAVQSGSGTPSPSNPRAISGFNSAVVTRCDKNLFSYDLTIRNGYWSDNAFVGTNAIVPKENATGWQYIRIYIEGLSSITLSGFDNQGGTNCAWLSSENVDDVISRFNSSNKNGTKTVPSGAKYLCLTIYSIKDKPNTYPNAQLEVGDTATTFEAYNGNNYTFAFGQTVFGGRFDNKGNLESELDLVTYNGSENWQKNGEYFYIAVPSDNQVPFTVISNQYQGMPPTSYTIVPNGYMALSSGGYNYLNIHDNSYATLEDFKTALSNTNLQVLYKKATPTVIQLTPTEVPTLLGENNIFSNTGDVEVNYYTSKSNDILEFINTEIGKKNGTNIPIEADSQDSIKDYIDDEVSTITTSLSGKADKTEDATITVESGYTLISSSCGKTDRLVHLNFNVEKTGGFATGWQAIGTTEFKPNTLVYCPLWNVTNGLANGEVRIDTDGTINFYVVTAGELRLNANIGYITD